MGVPIVSLLMFPSMTFLCQPEQQQHIKQLMMFRESQNSHLNICVENKPYLSASVLPRPHISAYIYHIEILQKL